MELVNYKTTYKFGSRNLGRIKLGLRLGPDLEHF
jgi:hypothetical protein